MQLSSVLSVVAAITAVSASPIDISKRDTCTFGAYQCSGQSLNQCAYGAGGVLNWTLLQTCGTGTYCTTSGYVGCLTGTNPNPQTTTAVAKTTTTSTTTTTTTTTAVKSTTTNAVPPTTTAVVKTTTAPIVQTTTAAVIKTTTTAAVVTTTGTPPPPSGAYQNLIVSYWGAHPTAGELSLATYCDLNVYSIIQLSFINAGTWVFDSDITQRDLKQVAADVLYCQSKGIRIGASVGGQLGSAGLGAGLGKAAATTLWNNFLGGSTPLASRVLPGVVLDGIDIDVESNDGSTNAGYAELVNELRSLIVASGKQYYISAAPQCPIPDANMDYTLKNGWFDFVSVQFYSALCGLAFSGPQQGPNYADNSSIWNHNQGSWMSQTPLWPNKNVKLVVGFPASANAGNFGASDPWAAVSSLVPGWKALNPSIFGGLMWWDCFWMGLTDGAKYKTFVNSLPN
ncbi:glycoside hydrolase [Rhizoclosmatium globosum]|uniref:chitinase n=1 Tax=Rhizoclosmatium globosum TaxID=329046 RepID=A0A1Y2B7A3_9FUNG|nr:glycoside hydrolase [Rhizoclosmatium globosum]|eukprot:ORY30722.1 glycoside hydrolase [Rhizoclosmatium globosum]